MAGDALGRHRQPSLVELELGGEFSVDKRVSAFRSVGEGKSFMCAETGMTYFSHRRHFLANMTA